MRGGALSPPGGTREPLLRPSPLPFSLSLIMTENNDRFSRWADSLPLWLTQLSSILSRKPPLAGIPGPPPSDLLQQRSAAAMRHHDFFVAALATAEKYLATDPENLDWLLEKALCLRELGQDRAALAVIAVAERLAPGQPDVLFTKASALIGLGNYRRAESLLRHLVRIDPADGFFRYEFAVCAALQGKPRLALRQLELAMADDDSFRLIAADDEVFSGLRSLPAYQKLMEDGWQE